MNRHIVGATLLIAAGVILTAGTVGAQIASAIVKAGFHSGAVGGNVPPAPSVANPHWIVVAAVLVLAGASAPFLSGRSRD